MSDERKPCACQPGRCELADANRDRRYCKIGEHDALVARLIRQTELYGNMEEGTVRSVEEADAFVVAIEKGILEHGVMKDKARVLDWLAKIGRFKVDVVKGWVFVEPEDLVMGGHGTTLLAAVQAAMAGEEKKA